MTGNTLRIGIAGLGFGQRVHVPTWKATPGCEVVAVCSAHADKAQKVAAENGIAGAYSNVEQMLSENSLNVLSVAVPPTEQPAIFEAAAAKGVNVFFEKPLAADLDAAIRIAGAAERAGIITGADFIFPELATWKAARDHVNAGLIGTPTHVAVSWRLETYAARNAPGSWKLSATTGGGALNSFASHTFYYLEWLYGPVHSIDARLESAVGSDSRVECSLSFAGGTTATVSISTDTVGLREHRLQLFGTDGILELRNQTHDYVNGFELLHSTREVKNQLVMSEPAEFEDGRSAPVKSLVARFADSVRTRQQMQPGVAEALRVQTVMHAARRSDADRCTVLID